MHDDNDDDDDDDDNDGTDDGDFIPKYWNIIAIVIIITITIMQYFLIDQKIALKHNNNITR